MEKILVGIDSKTTRLLSVLYALNLAKRMDVKISILLVIEPAATSVESEAAAQGASTIRKQLEKSILEGRSDGTPIDFFVTYGSFKEELIKFIKEEKISLLVVDSPFPDRKVASEKLPALFGEIKLRTHCRIEVVHKKDFKAG
ncbi:MAG: universal stress protein [Desulfobacteraceae bacterium]|jgi:nucleotide-binding universal stress UspA family protein